MAEENVAPAPPQPTEAANAIVRAPQRSPIAWEPSNFDDAYRMARVLCEAQTLPKHLINRPADVVITIMFGRELGLQAGVSLREIVVVNGRPFISGKLRLALVEQAPECEWIECTETTAKSATWTTKKKGRPQPISLTFTIEDAQVAGLISRGGNDSPWTKYPKNMLRWRALTALTDITYSSRLMGFADKETELDEIAPGYLERVGASLPPAAVAPPKPPAPAESEGEVVPDALGQPVSMASPPDGPMGPDEVADELEKQMRVAGDMKTLAQLGVRAKGLPSELEERILKAFQTRKAELGKKS